MRPHVLVTSYVSNELLSGLPPGVRLTLGPRSDETLTREDVLAKMGDVDAVLCQNELRIDAELLAAAPRLRVVANATAGFDNMDRPAMAARGVWGTNCPASFAAPTADHTLALLLAVTRRLRDADTYVRSGRWRDDGWNPGRWDGVSLEGKTIGIVGYGAIGRRVAARAQAFGMNVVHFDARSHENPGWMPFADMLPISDVLSLHCPLTPETRHLINASSLSKLKRGAILLNVSRGAVARIDDVVAALRDGQLGGAGLDVFEFEPDVPVELFAMHNVVLTPHIGGGTIESKQSAWRQSVRNVALVLSDRAPETPVVTPMGSLPAGVVQ